MNGIDGAWQIGRDAPLEVRLPAGILEIVLIEINRVILVRRRDEMYVAVGPARAGNSAHGGVERTAFKAVGSEIDHAIGIDGRSEMPSAGNASYLTMSTLVADAVENCVVKRSVEQPQVTDLAVEVLGTSARSLCRSRCYHQGRSSGEQIGKVAIGLDRLRRPIAPVPWNCCQRGCGSLLVIGGGD